jgi:hypothetical protein
MTNFDEPAIDEDLTPRFRWRWNEHGIYLGVCSLLGAFVFTLHLLPAPARRPFTPLEVIQVRYLTAADEPPEEIDPFHDPRVIQPHRAHPRLAQRRPSLR